MILHTTNIGSSWWFSDQECADYAYICACLPLTQLGTREQNFIRKIEGKWRAGGGYLTHGQWDWFVEIAQRHTAYVCAQEDVARLARNLATGE